MQSLTAKLIFAGIISGAFFSFSFAPFKVWPLAFFSLLPVFWALNKILIQNKKTNISFWKISCLLGLITGTTLNLISYHWVNHTIKEFGHLPWLPTIFIFLLYSIASSTKFILFNYLTIRLLIATKTEITQLSAWPFLIFSWYIAELLGWQLFPWYGTNIISGNLILLQGIDLMGTHAFSGVWFFINWIIWLTLGIQHRFPLLSLPINRPRRVITVALLAIILPHLYGTWAWFYNSAKMEKAPTANIGIVQGNTPLTFLQFSNPREKLESIVRGMAESTRNLVHDGMAEGRKPDLILWPESAIPFLSWQKSEFLQTTLENLYKEISVPLVFNDIYYEGEKRYSNLWLFNQFGKPQNQYLKQYLLPFGETIPFGEKYPILYDWFPEISDFSSGKKSVIFSLPLIKKLNHKSEKLSPPFLNQRLNLQKKNVNIYALPLICYEIILPMFTYELFSNTEHKANLIINHTNDTWFGDSIESSQHFQLGVNRAIEHRVPLIRATNSGISGYVDPLGQLHNPTQLFVKTNRIYTVPILQNKKNTLYQKWGDLLFWIILLGLGLYSLLKCSTRSD